MNKDPKIFLEHILESIRFIEEDLQNFEHDTFLGSRQTQDSVIRRFEIIGEAIRNLPEDFKSQHPDVPWKQAVGMRDILIHEYFDIDLELVWSTTVRDLVSLKRQIETILKTLP